MKELSLPARLEELSKSGQIPLHMPGHKRNEALAEYLHTLGARLDITEITGFDDLHDAQGILRAAQERAAALWGVRKSWFLINGSTGGILAGIRALAPAGSRVLVARACHKSVFHALELCRLRPAFLQPQPVPGWSFAGPVNPESLAQGLAHSVGEPVRPLQQPRLHPGRRTRQRFRQLRQLPRQGQRLPAQHPAQGIERRPQRRV